MPNFNPNAPRTLGVEWPAGRDHPLPLSTPLGRSAVFDAAVTEPISSARLFIRSRQGNMLDPTRALYTADLYDADDMQPGQLAIAYSRPVSLVAVSANTLALPGGEPNLVHPVQDWPDIVNSAVFHMHPGVIGYSGGTDASAFIRYKIDPTWRHVGADGLPTSDAVDLSDKRILSMEIQTHVACSQIWDCKVQGMWSPTGGFPEEQLLVEGGYWAGGDVPHNAGTFAKQLCLVPGGRTRARGPGNDLRPADIQQATTDGPGYIGLYSGFVLQGGYGPYPWGFFIYDFVVLVAYGIEKRKAVGYGSAPRIADPNVPGQWVEFPWEHPTTGAVISPVKTAGHRYCLVARQNWFTLAGNDWRGLDSATTFNWQDFVLPGIVSHDVKIQNDFYWGTGLPVASGLDPESTRSPSLVLMTGGGSTDGSTGGTAGSPSTLVVPPAHSAGTISATITTPHDSSDLTWHDEDGWGWRYDATDPSFVAIQNYEAALGISFTNGLNFGGGAPASPHGDAGGYSSGAFPDGSTTGRIQRLTDTAWHAGDGFEWRWSAVGINPADGGAFFIRSSEPDIMRYEVDGDPDWYGLLTTGVEGGGDFLTPGSHTLRVYTGVIAGVSELADGSQPYVRPVSVLVWNRAVLHFREPDVIESQMLAQGFSNASAADDYGVITVAIRNHGTMGRQTAPLVLTLKHDATVLGTTTVEATAEAIGAYGLGDGLWYLVQRRFTGVPLSPGVSYRIEATSDAEIAAWELLALDSGDAIAGAITYGGLDDAVVTGGGSGPEHLEAYMDAEIRLSSIPDPVTGTTPGTEIMDTSGGLNSACAVATMERVRLTWTPSGDSALAYYEVERSDDDTATWDLVAQVAEPLFVDVEMPRNRPIQYRVRQVRVDGIWSEWAAPVEVTVPLAEWAVTLGSNMAPNLTVCYLDEPGYEWQPVDATRTATRYLSGRDRGLMLREIEARGDVFTRSLIVAFNPATVQDDSTLGGRRLFDPLLAIAHLRTVPYTAFADHRGRRWYVAARATNLLETEPAAAYRATVEFTEVAGPAPVRSL